MGFIIFLICVFIVFIVFKNHLKNKLSLKSAREDLAHIDVNAGNARFPSWIQNKDKVQEFYAILSALCNSRGIPRSLLDKFLNDENTTETLLRYAGALETRGSSFNDQAIAVADKIQKMCRLIWLYKNYFKIGYYFIKKEYPIFFKQIIKMIIFYQ